MKPLLPTLAALMLAAAGCSKSGPVADPDGFEVSGKIQLASGAPITGGSLILRPENGLHGATALIQIDGSFKLANAAGSYAIPQGAYRVYVRINDPKFAALRKAVHPRYQDSENGESDVIVEIAHSTNNLQIRLKP